MCGFTGFVALSRDRSEEWLASTVRAMAGSLRHRGPDDAGEWVDAPAGVALGFRRLSIIDLSPAGHQPMVSASGRYVITFNGEAYNFEAVRRELAGAGLAPAFRGHSDTEVVLAAVEAWGLEAAVRRFVGMFAFALWDRRERRLHLVRDRLGVKPLYYGRMGSAFLWGSELKSLRRHPAFDAEVDRSSIADLLRVAYVPAPHTIYAGVHKLLPGTILTLDAETGRTETRAYWTARGAAEAGLADPFRGTEAEAVDALDALLRDAVGLRMVADVPLGVFLSGGIDSSVVVAQMQAQSTRPVKTFSIGFREEAYDEAAHAREVARHLGTDHTELYATPEEAQAVIPLLPSLYDEPFADSSQIPTYLVCSLARQHVTVALSGDGGDELFAGYNRYFWGRGVWDRVGGVPRPLRRAAAAGMRALSPGAWDRVFGALGPVLPGAMRQRMPGDRLHKLAGVLGVGGPDEMYRRLVAVWNESGGVVRGADVHSPAYEEDGRAAPLDDFTLRMMQRDLVSYLPDDILVKVDRASMGVSLEAREPLLDHRLVEFAWRLPLSMKMEGVRGKKVLREVLYRYVPREMVERPKMGFGIPIHAWLRGPLRPWAEELLDEGRLRNEGFFDAARVRAVWRDHLSGRRNRQYQLWGVLMFQAWHQAQRAPAAAPAREAA
ncbi:asparagine synthase (glutamine-hydrolyzing) [Longimicrobium sp.]|uniref:asparagine synthase (glutamine-hydrolyzing) n=1 Tax=Longimicrobium sp. TaxID=2029185 RepID=UPI002E2F743D|nr:asparagine synthase (glutamine-hydrolyzing) [Longimicrobium sp.]HEX6039715.1 asparagine synthase (glutamine-hydrolyzing) [Longimicrobium sp.]